MPASILSKTARDRLKPRHEPYWHRLAVGQHLGYRKMTAAEGVWIAKYRDAETDRRETRSLGMIADTPERKAFDAAAEQARSWFAELALGVEPEAKTVADVCRRYAASLGDEGTPKRRAAEGYFARLVLDDPIAKVQLHRAREAHFIEWRKRIAARPVKIGRTNRVKDTPRTAGSLARDIAVVRAALNYALKKHWVSTALAWREALKAPTLAEQHNPRELYLTREHRRALLDQAKEAAPAFEPLLRASMLLPVRPGALADLTVRSFDARTGTVAIGLDKGHAPRSLKLSPQALALFKTACANKTPAAPIFAQPNGSPWDKNSWSIAMRAVVAKTNVPTEATLYHCRHAVLSDLVQDTDLPLLSIAQLAGTSVAMLERTYAKLRQDRAADAMAVLAV